MGEKARKPCTIQSSSFLRPTQHHLCFLHYQLSLGQLLLAWPGLPDLQGWLQAIRKAQATEDSGGFLQIIKLSSLINAIQPPSFASLCQAPAEAKNHVTAIATRIEKTCLLDMQLNASCHAARELVSLIFLKDRGKRVMRAVFIGATNILPLVDSQHVSL